MQIPNLLAVLSVKKLRINLLLSLAVALCECVNVSAQMVNIDYDFAFKWVIYKGPSEDMGAACGDEPTTKLQMFDDNNVLTPSHDCITMTNNACGSVLTEMEFNESAQGNGVGEIPFGSYLHVSNSPTKTVKIRWEYFEDDWGARCSYNPAFLVGDDYHLLQNYDWQIRGLTKHSLLVNFGAGTYHQSEYHDGWAISTDWFGGQLREMGNTSRKFTWTGSSGPDQFNGANGKPWDKISAMRVKYRWNYTGNASEIKPCNSATSVSWTADYPSWSFKASAGNQYTVSINVTTLSGENMLRILHPDGHTELANTYNGTCQSSCPNSLSFTTPTTGTYYIDVVNRTDYVDITDNDHFGASNNEGVLDPKPVPPGNLNFRLVSGGSPEVLLSTDNPQICPAGGSAVLTVQTTATAYIWYKDNVQFGNTLNTYTATEPGAYRVDVTTASGCLIPSNSLTITHIQTLPPPAVVTISRNGSGPVLLGQELTYTTAVIGAGPRTINYLWYDNTIDAADSLAGGLPYYPHPNSNSITYTFRARPGQKIAGGIGMYGSSAGASAGCYEAYETAESDTLALNTLIPTVSISAGEEYFCVGHDAVITLTAETENAGANPYYQWIMDGIEIPGANASTYTTVPGALDDLLPGNNTHTFTVLVRPTRPTCYSCPLDEVFDQVSDFKYIYHRQPGTSSFSVSACESYTVPSGDETYYADAVVTDTIPNYQGCDSIMTITVDITCNVWDGSVSSDWNVAENWSFNHVPIWYEDVLISGLIANQPRLVMDGSLPVEVGYLRLEDSPTLTLNIGSHVPSNGEVIQMIRLNYNDPISGAFTNLTNGAQIDVDGHTYAINYAGGTGNDLAFTYAGCTVLVWYQDSDNDSYGSSTIYQMACTQPLGYVDNDDDCDDNAPLEGSLRTWYHDADGDGFGNPAIITQACSQPFPYVINANDCDDQNNAIGTDCSQWTGATSTSWNTASNWLPAQVPTVGSNVVIRAAPVNQPEVDAAPATPATSNRLTIDAGATLRVKPGKALTVNGQMINRGTVLVKADASGMGSLITLGMVSGNGDFQMEQYLLGANTAGTPDGIFQYVSSPVVGGSSATYNAAGPNKLWSANEVSQSYTEITTDATALSLGQGYVARIGANGVVTFDGSTFNTDVINLNGLTRSNVGGNYGYNLIGNPYPSSVSWDDATRTDVETTIWYRTHTSGNVMTVDTYNATSTIGTDNSHQASDATGTIPPGQGFWVRVVEGQSTGAVSFTNAMRSHGTLASIYKQAAEEGTVRLNLSNETMSDETILHFTTEALDTYDVYDSQKMWATNVPQIYTTVGADSLTINGLNSIATNSVIDLGVKLPTAGSYGLNATSITVVDETVHLEDRLLGIFQDLNEAPSYAFISEAGNIGNRFALHFGMSVTGVSEAVMNSRVYTSNGNQLNIILSENATSGRVEVLDMTGRIVHTSVINSSLTSISMNVNAGVYLVRVATEKATDTHRVILN